MIRFRYVFFCFLIFLSQFVFSQRGNNLREHFFTYSTDTFNIDTLSIVPGSEILSLKNGELADTSFYRMDYTKATLIFNQAFDDTLRLAYRVLPYNFSASFKNKDIKNLEPDESGSVNPFVFNAGKEKGDEDIFKLDGLNKSGSISRGINFGNTQDLSVNSNLNLQLSGKVHENVNILAAITDNNIPIQPDGNTQQLQEFDQVYIQLFDNRSKLIAGDFQMSRPNSHFMNFYKRAQGGSFSTSFITPRSDTLKNGTMKTTGSAAVSKGKFARNVITGIEGNQGPYRLHGSENETFIIILSGTEKVYMDGILLSRGQENDYVIDYNSAEITFTATRLVTKDKRIIVEFQYSDKNYARSLFHAGNEYEGSKLKLRFNMYSEQDARNQPLQQDLDTEKKQLMADIGDSLSFAVFDNIDSVLFTSDQVLYELVNDTMIGTITYDSVFVYSTNPGTAFYRLGFSLVGQGNGNYNQVKSTANGKVFEWVAPVNGIPQGAYEPVTLLSTPKKRQMVTLGGDYLLSKNTKAAFEVALSNNDINTFSSKDSKDNTDIAFKVFLENNRTLGRERKIPWEMKSYMNYEQVNKNFTQVERFRSVEFERDWNLLNKKITETQHISTAGLTFFKKKIIALNYEANSFNSVTEYNAFKNSFNASFDNNNYEAALAGSYLLSEGFNNNTEFLRQKIGVAKKFRRFTIGVWEDQEQNKIKILNKDSLLASTYQYLEWEAYIKSADADTNKYGLSYKQRTDYAPFNNDLRRSTFGESIGFDFGLYKNPNSVLKGNVTYRTLTIKDPVLTSLKPENTILSRLEYGLKILKGTITSNTFYEIGSGLEVKKEFSFLKIPAGQGVYAYVGDLNGNEVQDLNEFEISPLPDKAEYIKVFTPTNEFIKVFTNQFNQIVNIDPVSVWGNKQGIKKLASRFSNQTAYSIDRKTNEEDILLSLNPFLEEIADSTLITLNSSIRNTVFFNRTHPKFGLDYSWQDNGNKTLLTNGVESRTNIFESARARWNITPLFLLNLSYTEGKKSSFSEFFSNRNFIISYYETEPKITFQPGTSFRAGLSYKYTEKKNDPLLGGEMAKSQNIGMEIKYSIVSKGNLLLNVNYILNDFNASDNTTLAFEMLEGLQAGKNVTWSLAYQRNLSANMQLSLNYTGRTSESAPTVHTGGVQVRAFF